MAEKDRAEKVLEDYNDVFADIYNTLLFRETFLEEGKLDYGPTESVYKADKGELKEQRRDVLKVYKDEMGLFLFSTGIENQSTIDKYMPVRIMGYDYATYRSQIINEKKLTPVITIVLNFSDKKWDEARSLHGLLKLTEKVQSYVQDYKIMVFDVAFLEDEIIENFQSDFKVIARFFKKKRLGQLTEVMSDDEIELKHPEEILELLKVFTGDERYTEAYTNDLKQRIEKGEKVTMCKVIDFYEQRGMEKGIEKGQLQMLLSLVQEGDLTVERAAEKAKMSVEEFSGIINANVLL